VHRVGILELEIVAYQHAGVGDKGGLGLGIESEAGVFGIGA